MSVVNGFCERCNKFRKRHCNGDRNTCMSILFDTIEALQQENEQLWAQVARMREALELIFGYAKVGCMVYIKDIADEALSTDTVQDYHNPADVEVLRKAREAIQKAYDNYELIGEYEYDISSYLEEALAKIDKALGGGQGE